ncbi:DUF948 domain-containing protein [Dactylosporangium sp. AC04546]|uniref:DUF948 domain-containing protein n=1 Tax=Dactylosporangium sp. AC04546 TaxID=2862460 RepID=UPI001EDE180C|nr:DUF948 domain-containing protein [Dactylosporangium sp. AC04546]WVK89766.1 DUF948 domain-containing protein [Dactylosporangium sp. AC04546]
MTWGGLAALIAALAFLVLVCVLAVPILRLRHTVDAATAALRDAADQTTPMLERVNMTIDNVNVALQQTHTTLDGVNMQLARIDTITENVSHISSNVANLSTVVSAAAANPLVKVAAFGYGVRKAAANRRREADEAEVREQIKQRRRHG